MCPNNPPTRAPWGWRASKLLQICSQDLMHPNIPWGLCVCVCPNNPLPTYQGALGLGCFQAPATMQPRSAAPLPFAAEESHWRSPSAPGSSLLRPRFTFLLFSSLQGLPGIFQCKEHTRHTQQHRLLCQKKSLLGCLHTE